VDGSDPSGWDDVTEAGEIELIESEAQTEEIEEVGDEVVCILEEDEAVVEIAASIAADDAAGALASLWVSSQSCSAGHSKGKRPSTKPKHQRAAARKRSSRGPHLIPSTRLESVPQVGKAVPLPPGAPWW
jgi:hypothetical protein